MEKQSLRIFLAEIARQCDYARRSVEDMNRCLEDTHDASEFFRAAHSFLQCYGLVSKLLWPPSKKPVQRDRGQELRTELHLSAGNGINDRTLRNSIEHYDEILDDWVRSSPHHSYVDNCIGPLSAFIGGTITEKDVMRHFEEATNVFTFRGERYNLQKMVDDLKEIEEKVNERLTRRCS